MKKSLYQHELFPLSSAGETYYVSYPVLKEIALSDSATDEERWLFNEVRTIFEPIQSPTVYA